MAKHRREHISPRDFHLVDSILDDVKNGKLPPLTISTTTHIEEELRALERQKQQLIDCNTGSLTQWPRRDRERWYALITRCEELISLDDIRRLNPDLCQ